MKKLMLIILATTLLNACSESSQDPDDMPESTTCNQDIAVNNGANLELAGTWRIQSITSAGQLHGVPCELADFEFLIETQINHAIPGLSIDETFVLPDIQDCGIIGSYDQNFLYQVEQMLCVKDPVEGTSTDQGRTFSDLVNQLVYSGEPIRYGLENNFLTLSSNDHELILFQ